MKKTALLLILLFSSLARGQFWENPNQKPSLFGMRINRGHILGDPVACWLMSEGFASTVYDLSGNGNTGTLEADTHWVSGKFGASLSFDGTGDYVSTGKTWPDFITADESTFVVWVKPTGAATSDANPYNGQSILGEAGPTFIAFCRTDHIGDKDAIWAMMYDGATKQVGVAYTNNAWNCVAMVHGAGVLSIYNNGVFGDSTACGSIADISDTMRIGQGAIAASYWLGEIGPILIYNRALSSSEIALLYRESFCYIEPNWDMELYGWMTAPAVGAGQVIYIMN